MTHDAANLILALAVENTELRTQLAEVQEQCIELAIDTGDMHARLEALQAQMAVIEAERDAWRAEAEARPFLGARSA